MAHYMLAMQQPDGPPPEPEVLDPIMDGLARVNGEIREAGAWVVTAGLMPADSATVVRREGERMLVTDGPYVEATEHLGGFWIIDVPDLDAALDWANRIVEVTTLPIEVRAVAGHCG
ncbi:hypothetical protein HJD18_02550 [Thermoleophilia bacterium SCSIO 60948]|nr:hypothetical protein HJD18_02550 [Thermoleophilia bacterium SCSIO 60948]